MTHPTAVRVHYLLTEVKDTADTSSSPQESNDLQKLLELTLPVSSSDFQHVVFVIHPCC